MSEADEKLIYIRLELQQMQNAIYENADVMYQKNVFKMPLRDERPVRFYIYLISLAFCTGNSEVADFESRTIHYYVTNFGKWFTNTCLAPMKFIL